MSLHRTALASLLVATVLMVALPALAGTAEVGKKAPDFTLTDTAGKQYRLSDYAGKIVVLEWTNPQCPFVQRHYSADRMTMVHLANEFASEDVVWLAVDSSHFVTPEADAAWAKTKKIPYPILLDPRGEVGRAYGAKTTPHMFVISKEGTLLYNGAIDDDAYGKKDHANNYVATAVQAAMTGQSIGQAETKPYGCSVKYSPATKSAKVTKTS